MSDPERLEVQPQDQGRTVLELLADRFWDVPTSDLKRLVQAGEVTLEGRSCGPGQGLQAGQALELFPEDLEHRPSAEGLGEGQALGQRQGPLRPGLLLEDAVHCQDAVPTQGLGGGREVAYRLRLL